MIEKKNLTNRMISESPTNRVVPALGPLEVDSFRPGLTMFAQTARHQIFGPDDSHRYESNADAHSADEAIALRLRDCWNACDGIADPSAVPKLFQLIKAQHLERHCEGRHCEACALIARAEGK